ncbi:FUT1-like protein, partial [Mya arenaria]
MTCFEIFWLKYGQHKGRTFTEKRRNSVNDESDSYVASKNKSCDTFIPSTKQMREGINGETHPVCNAACRRKSCNTYMSFKGPQGRAGNLMFQIAALIGVAKRRGFTPQLRYNHFMFEWFQMSRLYVNVSAVNETNVGEEKYGTYQRAVESLDGGQNWTLGVVNVCVHVRRGDITSDANVKLGYVPSDATYLKRSMEYFRSMFRKKTVHFVFISNGMEWCKSITSGPDVYYSPFKEAVLDFALMVCCDHVIITIGSFGWWGAWLSGGITVYDSSWPTNDTYVGEGMNRSD